jgi:multiple sugar transport system permease protein
MKGFFQGLRWLVFLVAAFAMNFPVIVTLVTSLKSKAELSINPGLLIKAPSLSNYQQIFNMADRFDIFAIMWNSVVASVIGAFLPLLLCLPAAYAIGRLGFARSWLLPMVVNLRAIPLVIFAIPIYMMFQVSHLLDTRLGLGLILALVNLPLTLVLLVNAIADIPKELDEAARIDGASTQHILRHVVLPLAWPSIATCLVFGFITAWNEYLFGLILTTRRAVPMTVGASFFFSASGGGVQWGVAAAVMILGTFIPSVLGIVMYRRISESLTSGAIKG